MALTRKNWTLNSYTNATWTNVVAEAAVVACITIANTAGTATSVQLQLDNGSGTSLATILPAYSIAAGESYTVDVRSLNVTGSQRLQFQANQAGAEVLASGAV